MGDEADRIINDGLMDVDGLMDAYEPCEACGGTGWQTITEAMASDAGALSMAGRQFPCYACSGSGES